MITVAFLNQKGGVGKTSLCMHLAGALADAGRNVLAIDNDPQASLTRGLIGQDDTDALPPAETAAAIAAGDEPDPRILVREAAEAGFQFVPGSAALGFHNLAGPFGHEGTEVYRLRAFLAECDQEYLPDVCLVDLPPNLQLCSLQALAAADYLVIPTPPEDYGAQGLRPVVKFYEETRDRINPGLAMAGIVINRRRTNLRLHAFYEAEIRAGYGDIVFEAVVPDLGGYAESITHRLPITAYDPRSNAGEAMYALTLEFLDRIGA